jgi:hypothetical protein
MSRTLYDLAASNPELRFSPFCWRAKMALRHKGLDFETIAWRFTEKDIIARTRQGRVPVLVDDERWVHDSWEIALYLDQTYPDRPLLMRDATERAMARFVSSWCDQTLHPIIRSTFLLDIHDLVADRDRAYFRESREKTFGRRLEELAMEGGPDGAGAGASTGGGDAERQPLPCRRRAQLRRLLSFRFLAMGARLEP